MKVLKVLTASIMFLVMLSGCGTSALITELKANPDEDLLSAIRTVAIPDAQAALDDANAHNDKVAAVCWAAIHDYLVANPTDQLLPNKNTGALLAIQKARDAVNNVSGGIPTDLKVGCAALVQDFRVKGMALAAMIAGASHGVPPIIPFK